jgi:hypothetical protein
LYEDNKNILRTGDELNEFIEYKDKFIIGLDKNKQFIIKNFSRIENDDDVFDMQQRRELDKELDDNDLYNEFEEI